MAAGQGFKTFATGDVLSASDVNGYLMQGVLVFADATERNAEITSPQEGQFAYLKDTNVTTYYTGSAWANLDTTGMTNPMTTTGDMIYSSSGSTPARLGIGSTGQILTVAGGVPTWAAASGGGFPAWTAYTPTVTPQSGSLTAYTAKGIYSQSGKTVCVSAQINITTNGTATSTMYVSLPIASKNIAGGLQWIGAALEGSTTGYSGWASVLTNSSTVNLRNYNFGTFFGTGNEIAFTVTYEVA
jgi:hypothetical protein